MNCRQAKKEFVKGFMLVGTYSETRRIRRREHINSIATARKHHRNYWESWDRGYPNRFPYNKYFGV